MESDIDSVQARVYPFVIQMEDLRGVELEHKTSEEGERMVLSCVVVADMEGPSSQLDTMGEIDVLRFEKEQEEVVQRRTDGMVVGLMLETEYFVLDRTSVAFALAVGWTFVVQDKFGEHVAGVAGVAGVADVAAVVPVALVVDAVAVEEGYS